MGQRRNWSASEQAEKEMRQEEYTYLAPIIFMDYIDLIYYTDYVLYGACVEQGTHPSVKNRKNKLFSVPDDPKYEFDTVEGNAVYNGFLTVFDEYKTQLYLKRQRGKLDKIIDPDRLKRVEEEKREQKRSREESFAELIIDQYLEIIPEIEKKDIVFLGTDSFSLKPGNIRLDIKNLLVACAELFVSFNIPETPFNYIQLALLAFMFAAKVTVKSLNSDCAVIVYTLDQLGAYEVFVTEERVKKEAESISSKAGKPSISDFEETIDQLLEMKVIRMEDGKIALNETVLGKL